MSRIPTASIQTIDTELLTIDAASGHDIAIKDVSPASAGPVRLHDFGHPWFAVTDSKGRFSLPSLPAGQCEVVCDHEIYG